MWTIDETIVTTRIITPESVSRRSDQATSTPPAEIQVTSVWICGPDWPMISRNRAMPKAADSSSAPQVTICEPRSPITRPKNPAMIAASSGRKTTRTATRSASHHPNVLDSDRAAIAEIDDEDGESDCRLRRRDGQHEHREDLTDQIVEPHRKGDEVDVDRKQHQFDRHQDDDDVLAVEEDPENPQREQDRGNREVLGEANRHRVTPRPRRRPEP